MKSTVALARGLGVCLMAALLVGCVSQTVTSNAVPEVNTAKTQLPENQLLDVGIVIFDPGLEDDDSDLLYPEVRRAEARYMPYLLMEAIQSSAAWGAVRVVPDEDQSMDLVVQGTIEQSHGEELRLHVLASDATGHAWLDKDYKSKAGRYSYSRTTRQRLDPFQTVYNQIANDLLKLLENLSSEEIATIRLINELRFARSFSPDAFDDHLEVDRKGNYRIKRLPANDDPMLLRVRKIRERDYLFIDTMQEYYASFNVQMDAPYQEWRKQSYEEAVALRELKAESTRRLIAGVAAVVAGVAAAGSNNNSTRAGGNVALAAGGLLIKSGLEKRTDAELHIEAMEELSLSLESEIAPQIIELEDRTVTLTGSVQDQYQQWRELLRQIYQAEVGDLAEPPTQQGEES